MNFSLRTLLIITAVLSILLASLVYSNPFVGDVYYTLGLLAIGIAVISAIYNRGPNRAYWVGFVILFAGYFCQTVWPSEIRTTWLAFSNDLGFRTSGLLSNRLLMMGFDVLHGAPPRGRIFNPGTASGGSIAEKYFSFLMVGHTAIAVLLGMTGGEIARRLAIRLPWKGAASADQVSS